MPDGTKGNKPGAELSFKPLRDNPEPGTHHRVMFLQAQSSTETAYTVTTEIPLTPDEYEVYQIFQEHPSRLGFSCETVRYLLEEKQERNLRSYFVRDLLVSLAYKSLIGKKETSKKLRYFLKVQLPGSGKN